MPLSKEEWTERTQALSQWIKDQVALISTKKVVIGISGGKDSSVVAALCVHALGADRVIGVLMPDGEQQDIAFAEDLCDFLHICCETINIAPITSVFWSQIEASRLLPEIKKQSRLNLPPRVRMTLLYGIAQSLDAVVVNTSNLSEDWVGYATVYGDTAGAFSPLAMFTTDEVIQIGCTLGLPERFIQKPPADGLTGQTDEDILGFSYAELNDYIRTGEMADAKLKAHIDRLHRISRFKFQVIPMFPSGLPIRAKDIAGIYQQEIQD